MFDFEKKWLQASESDRHKWLEHMRHPHIKTILAEAEKRIAAHAPTGPQPLDGEIGESCKFCNDPANWDYPGGSIAHWAYCGPLGLGCDN